MPTIRDEDDKLKKLIQSMFTQQDQMKRFAEDQQRIAEMPLPTGTVGALFSFPKYDRGGNVLIDYLEDKQATGLVESLTPELPPNVNVAIRLCAGAYRDVIEPWLEEFVHPNLVCCCVSTCPLEGKTLGKDFTRVELRTAAADLKVLATIVVTPYFKGRGEFKYVVPGYRYIVR